MLERLWIKGTLFQVLVVMQIEVITMENSLEIPLKTRNKTAIWSTNPCTGHILWRNHNQKRHMHPSVHHSTIYNSYTCFRPRGSLVFSYFSISADALGQEMWDTLYSMKEGVVKLHLCECSQGPARADVCNGAENKRPQGSGTSKTFTV